ncbi:hypothetical protein ACQJBY_008898 [Aegilops geniculata]
MGAEKWLDIELWSSPAECFDALKKRGYRIACTSLGSDSVSVYDMDWSHPTAIVVGNETMGISDVALKLSDMHCSVPMKGMVDSFNVSVAAGILMHHAVYDRVSRLHLISSFNYRVRMVISRLKKIEYCWQSSICVIERAQLRSFMNMPKGRQIIWWPNFEIAVTAEETCAS